MTIGDVHAPAVACAKAEFSQDLGGAVVRPVVAVPERPARVRLIDQTIELGSEIPRAIAG